MKKIYLLISCILLFTSCSKYSGKKEIFISDRHGFSYYPVKEYCDKNDCRTLVLFDFHNDVNPYKKEITSFNWVGKLIENETIEKVYWICLYSLSNEDLIEKKNWLKKNSAQKTKVMVNKIEDSFEILGFEQFLKMNLEEDIVVSFDLDLVTLDLSSPSSFTKEICEWINNSGSNMVTACFSESYQTDTEKSFNALYELIQNLDENYKWFLLSNEYEEINESLEDIASWNYFDEHPEIYAAGEQRFYRGAYFWLWIPKKIACGLVERGVCAYREDKITLEIINFWKNNEYREFCNKISLEKLKLILKKIEQLDKEDLININCGDFELINDIYYEKKSLSYELSDFGLYVSFGTKKRNIAKYVIPYGVSEKNIEEKITNIYSAFINSKLLQNFNNLNSDYSFENVKDEIFVTVEVFSNFTEFDNWFNFLPSVNSFLINNGKEYLYFDGTSCTKNNFSKDNYLDQVFSRFNISFNAVNNNFYKIYKCDCIYYLFSLRI